MYIASSSANSISIFCSGGRSIEVESGGDQWVVRVIKCNLLQLSIASLWGKSDSMNFTK